MGILSVNMRIYSSSVVEQNGSIVYLFYEMPLPALFSCVQADKLVSKSTFPASANNNEMARHLYYLGRVTPSELGGGGKVGSCPNVTTKHLCCVT